MGIYQKMIEEAVSHTPLEAMFAKELDRLSEKIKEVESQLPRTFSQQMQAISSLPSGSIQYIFGEKDI